MLYHRRKKKCEISALGNMAYCGEVKLEPGGGEYEELNKFRFGQGNSEHSADDDHSTSKQAKTVYITAEDIKQCNR